MPINSPAAFITGPPSSLRESARSSTMRRARRPPARLCHSGPLVLMTPSRARGRPVSSAPYASASSPTRHSIARGSDARARGSASLSTATLVPGSRPASDAVMVLPPANTTSNVVASGSDCSDVTIASPCHRTALSLRSPATRTAASDSPAFAARAASALENSCNAFIIDRAPALILNLTMRQPPGHPPPVG